MNLTKKNCARPYPAQGKLLLSNYTALGAVLRPYEVNIYRV